MYTLIDGKAIAAQMRAAIKVGVAALNKKYNREIGLAVVLVGENPASQIYVRNKIKACEEVGIKSYSYKLPQSSTQGDVESLICDLVKSEHIDGILVQLPLPKHLDAERILSLIPAAKDVDGFSDENIGKLVKDDIDGFAPCTAIGIMVMLERYKIPVKGKKAVVVGRSNIVGRPIAMLLLNADATVTICHSKTANLKQETLSADILVSAVGKAKFITADMVKEGAVVIDVGMNRDENDKLCGDVDFEAVKSKCSYVTPVPGGVGPMTITMLMQNTYISALNRGR